MLSVILIQAAAEYAALLFSGALRVVSTTTARTVEFITTPKGIVIAALIIILLFLTLGRRRSF